MDGSEDPSYLSLLNDGTAHNYLLQTSEGELGVEDPGLNIEPMFTEMEDGSGGWSVGLPILMNGEQELGTAINLPTNDNNVETAIDLPAALPGLYENGLENQEQVSLQQPTNGETQMRYPIEIPGKGFITADGLFIANDLLLQLKLGDNLSLAQENSNGSAKVLSEPIEEAPEEENILMNPKTLLPQSADTVESIHVEESAGGEEGRFGESSENLSLVNGCLKNDQIFNMAHLNSSSEIIQLLNTDGTVINITKDQLMNYDVVKEQESEKEGSKEDSAVSLDEMFEIVMAHKCRQCSFLCENRDLMLEHWNKNHLQVQDEPKDDKLPAAKESSISEEVEEKNGLILNGEVKMKSILKTSDHQTVYLCSECNLGYGSTDKLKNHMITAHKLVQRPDDAVVNGNAATVNNKNPPASKPKVTLALLQKQVKASKKIKCSVKGCDLRFSMDDMRERHEKCHVEGQKKQFKCFECDNKFSIWRVCSMHMWKCHKVDLGLFTCPMCSVFKASSAVRLITHMAIHEEEKPFICSDCGKGFKQHNQLRNHQVLHKKVENIPDWAGQQQCDICKKYFANSKSLKKHVQSVHDKFKPFICNICGHKAARKAMLELHLRQHTGEKPHKCPICDYKTGDHNSLRRHVMRHSGDTKYSCPHCNYTSIQSTSYKNHIASKHPGQGGSFFCRLCSYHTVNENTYFSHLADHKNGLIKESCDNETNNGALHKAVVTPTEEKLAAVEVQQQNGKIAREEDDETQSYLLLLDHSNDAIDTGGITIPAGTPLNLTY